MSLADNAFDPVRVAMVTAAAAPLPSASNDKVPVKLLYKNTGLVLVSFVPVATRLLACVFHANVDTDSAANWTLIPRETGQGFQGKLDT